MHVLQGQIGQPGMKITSNGKNDATFTISPLPKGYGHTLGNAMRRALLSSLPGSTITAIKVTGATHEYATLPGVKDSVLDIILNLKGIRLKKHSSEAEIVSLEKKGAGPILAKHIKASSDVEILNPEHEITQIDGKSGSISIQLKIEKSVGYWPVKGRENKEDPDWILIDAAFSPVVHVKYEVVSTRVGDNTDLDKVNIDVVTNGSISPEDSVKFCAELLENYFNIFKAGNDDLVEEDFITDFSQVAKEEQAEEECKETYTPIEILNLSPRTLNALINGDIGSIEQLVKCSMPKLGTLRGFGKKAQDEVVAALESRSLSLSEE